MNNSVLAIVEPPHGRFVAFVAPRDDAIFVERAVVALEAALTDGGGPNPDVALDRLRPTYPRVVVRRRERFAEGGVLVPAAYVYRDGTLLGEAPGDAWWKSPDAARLVVSNGRYVAANAAALRLVNLSVEELAGRPAGDLTQPDTRVDPAWLWERLQEDGQLHSVSVIQPQGRDPVRVEFITFLDGDGPGRHSTFLREVADR